MTSARQNKSRKPADGTFLEALDVWPSLKSVSSRPQEGAGARDERAAAYNDPFNAFVRRWEIIVGDAVCDPIMGCVEALADSAH